MQNTHERFAHFYCSYKARGRGLQWLGEPRSVDEQSDYSEDDKSTIIMGCGATTTISGSFLNCTEVEAKTTMIFATAKRM